MPDLLQKPYEGDPAPGAVIQGDQPFVAIFSGRPRGCKVDPGPKQVADGICRSAAPNGWTRQMAR